MALTLQNSLTRRREVFSPIDPENVRMYVCGPTVYDLAHVGNARTLTVFDVLARLLRHLYPKVTYVRNITDVDDKINARAAESGEPISAITARTTALFHEDMQALGNVPPDHEPRATEHIAEMVILITRLLHNGHAYEAEDHVLFSVESFPYAGLLSKRAPEPADHIIEPSYKRHQNDFVLWKPSTPDLPGWDSPWGRGRPGWHIECSAMAWRYLGETFDIHGGGADLMFPHHENECAQSLCAFPASEFAKVWLHSGMLMAADLVKMSKSFGNTFTIRYALSQAPGEVIRLMLLRAHYRSELVFSFDHVKEVRAELDRFYRVLQHVAPGAEGVVPEFVLAALCDDLNTPAALASMHALADVALKGDGAAALALKASGKLLGLLQADPAVWFHQGIDEGAVRASIEAREAARKDRDFAKADAIRKEWLDRGVVFEDRPDGSTDWRTVSRESVADP